MELYTEVLHTINPWIMELYTEVLHTINRVDYGALY